MPVKLRLQRRGRTKSAFYAIVAADSRMPRDGRFIEKLGYYDPVAEPARVYVDHELALKWLQVGAQPTNTVRSLLRHAGVTLKFALAKQGKSEEEMERIYTRWRAEKDAKTKKKVISVDVHGTPLEPVPNIGPQKGYHAPVIPEPTPEPEPEAVAEAPAEEYTEAPAEEAPVAEEAPATEEAPAAEETTTEEAATE